MFLFLFTATNYPTKPIQQKMVPRKPPPIPIPDEILNQRILNERRGIPPMPIPEQIKQRRIAQTQPVPRRRKPITPNKPPKPIATNLTNKPAKPIATKQIAQPVTRQRKPITPNNPAKPIQNVSLNRIPKKKSIPIKISGTKLRQLSTQSLL